jgi:DNA polymerase-1
MRKQYLEYLKQIEQDHEQKSSESERVLLIDGLNLFIRNFSVNPIYNDNGIHIGGITGFLLSLGLLTRTIRPNRIIIAFDGKGGNRRRRNMFADYKSGRAVPMKLTRDTMNLSIEEERQAMSYELSRVVKYLDCLPVQYFSVDGTEADDAIGILVKELKYDSCYIVSTDRDYLQLVTDKVTVYSPIKKAFYTPDKVLEEYGIPAQNFLMYRVLTGDSSDNIDGVKGVGTKTIQKQFLNLFHEKKLHSVDFIDHVKSLPATRINSLILENTEKIHRNYDLMQLHEPNIGLHLKNAVMNNVETPEKPKLDIVGFKRLFVEDGLQASRGLLNIDNWLRMSFLGI